MNFSKEIAVKELKLFENQAYQDQERRNQMSKVLDYDRNRAINDMISSRMPGKKTTDESDDEPMDERERLSRSISNRRILEIASDNEAAQAAAQAFLEEAEDAEWDARRREEEAEMEEFDNEMELDEIKYKFEELGAQDGGFKDVWAHHDLRQPILDDLDLELRENPSAGSDWRTYKRVGLKHRERLAQLKKEPGLKKNFDREDGISRIAIKNLRGISQDNAYVEAGLPVDPKTVSNYIDDETCKEQGETFDQEFSDLSENSESYRDAIEDVDKIQQKHVLETGQLRTDYGLLQEAGERTRRKSALRDLAKGRGQNPEDIN